MKIAYSPLSVQPLHHRPNLLASAALPQPLRWGITHPKYTTAAPGPDETTPLGKEAKIEETLGTIFVEWLKRRKVNTSIKTTQPPTTGVVPAQDMITELAAYIQELRPGFVRLQPSDVDQFLDRINSDNTYTALRWLATTHQIDITRHGREKPNGAWLFSYTLNGVHAAATKPEPSPPPPRPNPVKPPPTEASVIENLLLQNLSWRRRAELEALYQIGQGNWKDGSEAPRPLMVAGRELPDYVRVAAYYQVSQKTGRLRVQTQGDKGHNLPYITYNVVPAASHYDPYSVHIAKPAVLALLYYLSHHEGLSTGAKVPANVAIVDFTGKDENSLSRARKTLEDQGLFRRDEDERYEPNYINRRLKPQQLYKLVHQYTLKVNNYIESCVQNLNNTQMQTEWQRPEALNKLIAYPAKGVKQNTKNRWTFDVIAALEKTPVPLLFTRRSPVPAHMWLNPAVDYNALNDRLTEMNHDPATLTTGAFFDVPPTTMPRLFEPLVHKKPAFKVTRHGTDYEVQMGLVDSTPDEAATSFKPLSQITKTPVNCPPPPTAGEPDERPKLIDLHHYAQSSLNLVRKIYPLPQLGELARVDRVTLPQAQGDRFLSLKMPLERMGYVFDLAI